jgi:hypothetical protein
MIDPSMFDLMAAYKLRCLSRSLCMYMDIEAPEYRAITSSLRDLSPFLTGWLDYRGYRTNR